MPLQCRTLIGHCEKWQLAATRGGGGGGGGGEKGFQVYLGASLSRSDLQGAVTSDKSFPAGFIASSYYKHHSVNDPRSTTWWSDVMHFSSLI